MKALSVIIITHSRTGLLKKCLESILKANFKPEYELLTVVNGPDKEALSLLQSSAQNRPNLKTISIAHTSKGSARNAAIKEAAGDILYFLDDDVEIEKDNLEKITAKFRQNSALDILGGPNLTPSQSSFFQKCSGWLLSSMFGSGLMRFRYTPLPVERIVDDKYLILCNLAFRRKVFEQEKECFNGDLACNEENLLLYNLKKQGYQVLYSPGIKVYHQRRPDLWRLLEQFFRYGRGRAQMTRLAPGSLPWFTILPSMFLLYLVSLLVLRNPVYLLPIVLYLFLAILFSLSISIAHKEIRALLVLPALFPLSHLAYGLGFLAGLVK